MTNSCNCQKSDCDCGSNSGFIFGLICGAVIGAVIAVIIYKNNKTEVFEKLEQKIKSFFDNLIPQNKPKTDSYQSTKSKSSVKKTIAVESIIQPVVENSPLTKTKSTEITPIFVKAKKPVPKTFIKPKK